MTEFTPDRLAEWEGDPSRWPHTPPLDVWVKLTDRDSNLVWRVESGHLVNLLETATDALESKNAEVESLAKEALHALPDNRLGTLSSYITALEQERDEARAEVDELRATLVELAPSAAVMLSAEVVVDGDVFTWGDLPDVLSRTGELLAEYRREAKDQCVKRRDAEAVLERVRALHRKRRAYADDWDTCTCGYGSHPCPTIRALETGTGQ